MRKRIGKDGLDLKRWWLLLEKGKGGLWLTKL